ncbi:MAG: cryptochrome/photolyase family protein, partial [Acidobacteria bacterium]|nr:cryptochrome/photolyase family protein [Acidobacteriota bacterium]
ASLIRKRSIDAQVAPNNMFLSDDNEFRWWARGRKSLRLEDFYREMRRRTGLLMHGGKPIGGKWNYDNDNRETPSADAEFPEIPRFLPDMATESLIALVNEEFSDHFGECDEFAWPVTRDDAQRFASDFLDSRLDLFGPYQDAIVTGEPTLYHSLLSPLINLGLLEPMWLCREAERRYCEGKARLNSVEGFIRQIIGWREFVYQVYHLKMPQYTESNHFEATLPLPSFYWNGDTDMYWVSDAVRSLIGNGINHHIQRLMITGNFALIAGLDPQAVNEWYWSAYADGWEWVVTPNVLGMALYADGGIVGSKPYAASANYINRMSDGCGKCDYDRRKTVGSDSCPFNSLYWDFIDRNWESLSTNRRMSLAVRNLDKREPSDVEATRARAHELRQRIQDGERI